MNRTFCLWVGRDAEELVGRVRFQDLLTIGARIFHQTHWAPLIRMQGTISEVKLDVKCKDGSSVPMMLNARLHSVGGTVVHEIAAFVARDRDKYEKELVLARGRLEAAIAEVHRQRSEAEDRALLAEQLIGIVSHDLRTPLSAIAMGTALLEADAPETPRKKTLERISRSTARATRLINDLLDFTGARLGRGLRVSFEDVNLHEVAAHAVEELALVYPANAVRHVGFGDGRCRADHHRIAQVVGNLVANAATYGDAGGVVTVSTEVTSDTAILSVHNTGRTIPVEASATIFQPMSRGTDEGAPSSVGLGLFIVAEIARAHGGTARVVSTEADGTTFCVSFPRHQQPGCGLRGAR